MADVYGRVLPCDIEAEKAFLGIMLVASDMLAEFSTKLMPDDFYERSHRSIFSGMLTFKQEEATHTLDLVSFTTFLRGRGKLEECGGASYLAELSSGDHLALSRDAELYAKAIKDNSRRRRAIEFGAQLQSKSYDLSESVQTVIDEAQNALSDLSTEGSMTHAYIDMNSLMVGSVDKILRHREGEIEGVPSGFEKLDDMTGGFRKQELTIIGARPSVGKTAFALSVALNMILNNVRVGFFSLEMPVSSLGARLIAAQSQVNFSHIRKGTLSQEETQRIYDAVDSIYNKKIFIQDTPNMKLMDLRAQAKRMKLKEDVQVIFIDYIGLIEYENQSMERFNQVSQISRSLKQLARELDIPIVVLCQVGRQAEGNEPRLSDLRDSGSIEQDADLVILLHRERTSERKEQTQNTKIILAKNRNGETGTFDLGFQGAVVRFINMDRPTTFVPGRDSQ